MKPETLREMAANAESHYPKDRHNPEMTMEHFNHFKGRASAFREVAALLEAEQAEGCLHSFGCACRG